MTTGHVNGASSGTLMLKLLQSKQLNQNVIFLSHTDSFKLFLTSKTLHLSFFINAINYATYSSSEVWICEISRRVEKRKYVEISLKYQEQTCEFVERSKELLLNYMFNSTHIDMKSPVNTGGINTMQCVEAMHNINTLTLIKLNGRGP